MEPAVGGCYAETVLKVLGEDEDGGESKTAGEGREWGNVGDGGIEGRRERRE